MSKKGLLISLGLVGMSLASCGGSKVKINKDKEHYEVGICQIVTHGALDSATEGFKRGLETYLLNKGRTVEFDYQNAAGDVGTCTTIVNKFVSHDVDLILANATPAVQAAANASLTIPILGTSVTDYGVALGIEDFDGVVGGNISGTSDLAPLDQQADLVSSLFPSANKIAILYCASEANSLFQDRKMTEELKAKGKEVKTFTFTDSNDLSLICSNAVNWCDALYLPTDNTVASNTAVIDAIARPAKKPIFAGEEAIMKGCGCFTLSISYDELGRITGELAGKVLTGEVDITKQEVLYDANPVKKYNPEICQELGITVPAGFVAM